VNRETGALRQAFNLAAKRRPPKLSRVPYVPMLNEDNARQGFVEPSTFEALVQYLPEPINDVARFAYLSGWRRGEVLPLRWPRSRIQIRASRGARAEFGPGAASLARRLARGGALGDTRPISSTGDN